MINITNKVGRQLWRIEVDREMQLLERSPIKKWTSFLYSQYSRAAALIAVGRVDDIDFIFADDSAKMAEMLLSHSRTVGNKFSQKAFSILSQRKFINPHSVKTPLDEFWGSFNIWMKENAAQKVTGINKTTKKSLAAMIKRGMEQQQTTTEISKNIRKAGKITAPHRAKTIALTETHAAAVKSMDVAVKASRIEMEKEWVGAKDMRTRRKGPKSLFDHFHAPPVGANGERVPMDKKFIGSGEPMDHPGDINGSAGNVVRCRCVLMYHTVKPTDTDRMKPHEPVPDVIGLTTAQTDAIKYCNKAGKIDDEFIDDMLLEYPGFEKDDILKLSKYIETHIGTDAMPLKINRGLYTERSESFRDVLQNGKMKNQFQLSAEGRRVTSGGYLDSSMDGARDRWEKNIFDGAFQKNPKYIAIQKDFGYKFTKELADERPVYGYIEDTANKGLRGSYGEVRFQLREGVKERTTFTMTNSSVVGEGRAGSYVGTYKNNRNLVEGILKGNLHFSGGTGAQRREAVARLKEEINDVLKSGGRLDVYGNGAYVEIQVHGGIDLAQDVAHISFPKLGEYDHIAELAKKYNIPFDRY